MVLWTTVYLRTMLQRLQSRQMIDAMVSFLIGTDTDPEPREDINNKAVLKQEQPAKRHRLRSVLLRRLDALNEGLCISTLHLFDALWSSKNQLVVSNLLTRNLRSFTSASTPASPASPPQPGSVLGSTVTEEEPYHCKAQSVLAQFKGLEKVPRTHAFDAYKSDGLMQTQQWMIDLQQWAHDFDTKGPPSSSSHPSKSPAPFYPGLFLTMLARRCRTFLKNSFRANLVLTSLISRMCHCPLPQVHRFMFAKYSPDVGKKDGNLLPILLEVRRLVSWNMYLHPIYLSCLLCRFGAKGWRAEKK